MVQISLSALHFLPYFRVYFFTQDFTSFDVQIEQNTRMILLIILVIIFIWFIASLISWYNYFEAF